MNLDANNAYLSKYVNETFNKILYLPLFTAPLLTICCVENPEYVETNMKNFVTPAFIMLRQCANF